ncbi:uncharacterized protein G2W53_010474 [Senna tora]|uniref:Uncharacterized protein n=1 Tax=Senna tora TaxID=362788 RepID=A0A834X0R6_9FABA|nr:uncharacterized protein G2W53_010474 [Senna tora]
MGLTREANHKLTETRTARFERGRCGRDSSVDDVDEIRAAETRTAKWKEKGSKGEKN